MDNKFAVCDGGVGAGAGFWTIPSRDLNGASDTAIRPLVESPAETWELDHGAFDHEPCADDAPLYAGLDQKLSQGSEQSSDLSARCAEGSAAGGAGVVAVFGAGSPSLDLITRAC